MSDQRITFALKVPSQLRKLCDVAKDLRAIETAGILTLPAYKKHVLEVKFENTAAEPIQKSAPLLPFAVSNVLHADIVHWRRLTGPIDPDDNCKVVYEVTFDVKNSNLKFKAGDTIGVIPENGDDEVDLIISHLGLESQADVPYTLSVLSGEKGKIPAHIPARSTLRHVFKYCVDLRGIIKKLFLLALSKYTENEAERNTLEYLSSQEGRNEYWGYVVYDEKPMLVMIDFFKVFKSCKPPVEVLLSHLPRLLPRPYSIVNSGLKDSNLLKICFSVISFKSLRKGLTTGWLEKMILNSDLTNKFNNLVLDPNGATEVNKVPIYLRKNTAQFSLPENKKNPLVLIAVGTAVAPFIGFLEELEIYKTSDPSSVTDDVWLFFGCRDPNLDHIYKKELTGFLDRGVLKKLNTVFSCPRHIYGKNDGDLGERYVQDSLRNNGKEIKNLMEAGASIYVCGDFNGFKNSIKVTLQTCLVNDGKTEDEAQSLICGMEKDRRFVFDIWA